MQKHNTFQRPVFFLTWVLFLFCLNTANAANGEVPSLSNPNLKKLNQRVYVLQGDVNKQTPENNGFNSNSTFVITDNSVVVLDPGSSVRIGRMIIKQIRKITNKPITHVFNSHHHPDHWLGNHAFSELKPAPKIIGHPYMKKRAGETAQFALRRLNKMTKGAHSDTKATLPNMTVNGEEKLKIGGKTFVLIHPEHAHTKGDLVVYIPEEKLLVTGDVFFHLRTPGFQDASPLRNNATLESLAKLDVTHVVPGHGPVTNRDGLQYMRTYITLLHDEVERLYHQGMTDIEMIDKIQIGKYREMSGFKTRFPVNVNSMFLEVVKKQGRKFFYQQIGMKMGQK